MSKHILVKTPLTSDGNLPVIRDGKQVYTESILGFPAKAILEKRNTTLPEVLRVVIEDYDGPVGVKAEGEQEIALPLANLTALQTKSPVKKQHAEA